MRSYLFSSEELIRLMRGCAIERQYQDLFVSTLQQMQASPAAFMYTVLSYYVMDYTPFTNSMFTKEDYDYLCDAFEPIAERLHIAELDIRVVEHFNNPEDIGILEQLAEVDATDELFNTIACLHPLDTPEHVVMDHLQIFMEVAFELVRQIERVFLQRQVTGSHSHALFATNNHNLLVFVL